MSTESLSSAGSLVRKARPAKAKKQPQENAKLSTAPKEKLSESLANILTHELANTSNQVNSSDLFDRITAPHKLKAQHTTTKTTTTTTKTTLSMVTTVVEQIQMMPQCTNKQGRSSNEKERTIKSKYKTRGMIFTLDDMSAITALESLVDRYGKVSHMGILDKSYSFFVTKARDGALYFKVNDKVAVVGGDPLCEPEKFDSVMDEFAAYRKQFGWGVAFLGATSEFTTYAQSKNWATMQFGLERVLNPMTNPLLLETGGGKRTISQSRQLLKKNITLGIYSPKLGCDFVLQEQLVEIYETWCSNRNQRPKVQAYMTVYDPFAIPELMTYIYTRDADGKPCGFAALRKIVDGYHIDPCIALPGSVRGISELLILSAMSLLKKAGVSYLSLGFEPSLELGEITGIPKSFQKLTRSIHRRTYRGLPIGGKRDFHDKFYPDEAQQNDLYLVFPGRPGIKHMKAMMHTVNISISKLVYEDVKGSLPWIEEDRGSPKVEVEKMAGADPQPAK